jgi:hypothetical protein
MRTNRRKKIAILVILIALFVLFRNRTLIQDTQHPSSLTPSASQAFPPVSSEIPVLTPADRGQCLLDDLSATITFDHAAGNVYGTFALSNISNRVCTVPNNKIALMYDQQAIHTILVTYTSMLASKEFTLNPGGEVTATLHYPNGPQCESGILDAGVSYFYPLAPEQFVSFSAADKKQQFTMPVCKGKEITEVTISGLIE